MNKEEFSRLLALDSHSINLNEIDDYILSCIDKILIKNFEGEIFSSKAIEIYKKFQPMKQQAPDNMKIVLFSNIRNFAKEEGDNGFLYSKLLLYRFLIVKSNLNPQDYIEIGKLIYTITKDDNPIIKTFINLYEKKESNKLLAYLEIAYFYKSHSDNKQAIKYYEKFMQINQTKVSVFNIAADLYSKVYGDESIEKQIDLYLKAYNLEPSNRLTLHGLAFGYEKLGDNNNAKFFYEKLLNNNPIPNDFYNYGCFLIHSGDLIQGHNYFIHRFDIDDINLQYPIKNEDKPRWDLVSDISGKILLIHYEQGFGDTIMYSRFVPLLQKIAQKIIFVVQDELYSLIKNSKIFENINVISSKIDLKTIKYDYTMALLDTPKVVGILPDDIPYSKGYLNIDDKEISQYNKDCLFDSTNYKIGISTKGAKDANYDGRDVDLSQLDFLLNLKNCKVYSFNIEDECYKGIIPLGHTFKDFSQSASALKNMDLVISTDNVILNLSGALGVKTIALFNKQTNFRWFKTIGEDIGWYKSVRPLQNDIQDDWNNTLLQLAKIVNKNICIK